MEAVKILLLIFIFFGLIHCGSVKKAIDTGHQIEKYKSKHGGTYIQIKYYLEDSLESELPFSSINGVKGYNEPTKVTYNHKYTINSYMIHYYKQQLKDLKVDERDSLVIHVYFKEDTTTVIY